MKDIKRTDAGRNITARPLSHFHYSKIPLWCHFVCHPCTAQLNSSQVFASAVCVRAQSQNADDNDDINDIVDNKMLYWMPWMRCMRCGYWLFGLRCVRNIGDKLCCQSKFIEWFELNLVAKQSMIKWSQSVKDICSFVLCTQCMWINSMWIDGRTKKCSFPPNILLVTFNRRKSYLRSCHDTLCADQTQTMGVHCRPLFFPHNRRKKNIYRHLASHNQPKKKVYLLLIIIVVRAAQLFGLH